MSDQELWACVAGFAGYAVSDRGRVFSFHTLDYMARRPDQMVELQFFGERHGVKVAELVLAAFDRRGEEDERVVFLDGDDNNCHIENLEWRSRRRRAKQAKPAQPKPPALSAEQAALARRLYADERSLNWIARHLGTTRYHVKRVLDSGDGEA